MADAHWWEFRDKIDSIFATYKLNTYTLNVKENEKQYKIETIKKTIYRKKQYTQCLYNFLELRGK